MKIVTPQRISAAAFAWRQADGSPATTAVCKITFNLRSGTSRVSSHPAAIVSSGQYRSEDRQSSLHRATDLVPGKRRADVILVGDAIAPGGQATTNWLTRLSVGGIDKRIRVFGDRSWLADGTLSSAIQVRRMPLLWERAVGGPGTGNPVGARQQTKTDASSWSLAPNLLPAGSSLSHINDFVAPTGYGPVAPSWSARSIHLQRHRRGWSHDNWCAAPLPEDVDWAYFNAAPRDQQLPRVTGQETIILENLIEGYARLETTLEHVTPALRLQHGSSNREIALTCDTLFIDAHARTCSLVWRATLGEDALSNDAALIVSEADTLLVCDAEENEDTAIFTHSLDSPTEGRTRPSPQPEDGGRVSNSRGSPTNHDSGHLIGKLNPRSPSSTHEQWRASATETACLDGIPANLADLIASFKGSIDTTVQGTVPSTKEADMPFTTSSADSVEMPLAVDLHAVDVNKGDTLVGDMGSTGFADWAFAPQRKAKTTTAQSFSDVRAASAAALLNAANVEPVERYRVMPAEPAVLENMEPGHIALESHHIDKFILEPSFIGPLATPEMRAQRRPRRTSQPNPEGEATADNTECNEPAEQTPQPAQPELPLHDYPLERCAGIAAAIDCRPDDESAILNFNSVDAELWSRLQDHYVTDVRNAMKTGNLNPLRAQDEAYVRQIERERGAITIEDIARLRIAAERGTRDAAMIAMKLPRRSLTRIERIWLGKTAEDVRLSERLTTSMEAARTVH